MILSLQNLITREVANLKEAESAIIELNSIWRFSPDARFEVLKRNEMNSFDVVATINPSYL